MESCGLGRAWWAPFELSFCAYGERLASYNTLMGEVLSFSNVGGDRARKAGVSAAPQAWIEAVTILLQKNRGERLHCATGLGGPGLELSRSREQAWASSVG